MHSNKTPEQRGATENDRYSLNRALRFFSHEGRRYGFMSILPYPLCYMALSQPLENMFKRFDGRTPARDIFPEMESSGQTREFITALRRAGVLLDPGQEESPGNKTPPPPHKKIAGLCILPTTDCNLRCVYCYSSAGDHQPLTVSMDAVNACFHYFFSHLSACVRGTRLLFQGGGEPTRAFHVMKEAWNRFRDQSDRGGLRPELRLVTNGVFDEEVLKWMIDHRAFVTVSLDGPPNIQNRNRPKADGSGSHAAAVYHIEQLAEAGLAPKSRASVTRNSIGEIPKIVLQAGRLGVSMLQLEPCRDVGRAKGSILSEPDGDLFVEAFLRALKAGIESGINVHCSALVSLLPGQGRFCNVTEPAFMLTPEGYISACPEVSLSSDPASRAFFYGSVSDGHGTFFNEAGKERLRAHRRIRAPACADCFVRDSCGGGCLVKSYRRYGHLHQRDPYLCGLVRKINAEVIAEIADGRLAATWRWTPRSCSLVTSGKEGAPKLTARLVTIIPPNHPAYKRIPPEDRPFMPPHGGEGKGTALFIPKANTPAKGKGPENKMNGLRNGHRTRLEKRGP